MWMVNYVSVAKLVCFYLTLYCLQVVSQPFNPVIGALSNPISDENDDSSSSIVYEDTSIEDLPFKLQNTQSKYLNFDRNGGYPKAYGSTDALTSLEKKATRNFLRFGRGHPKNFLRFGRGGPMEFGLGLVRDETEENGIDKRANDRNFLRFGRRNIKNFIRFGRAADRNFIRFGRSIGKQLDNCKDCGEIDQLVPLPQNKNLSGKLNKNISNKRDKRSIPAFYDDLLFMAPTPLSWIENLGSFGANPSNPSNNDEQGSGVTNNGQKRAHSFLRYGRDPLDLHFLRFGKRGSQSALVTEFDQEKGFSRDARTNKNFLRFG